MNIPFLDLKKQYLSIKPKIDRSIRRVIDRTDFIMGDDVYKLEEEIANFTHSRFAIGLNSGTDALYASLKALGIGKGDEVITTPFTFVATAETITLTGARPVFVDIDPRTFTLDPQLLSPAITKKTRAIIPVHLFGQSADMDPILRIAKRHHVKVIEDAAQALGATYHKRPVGSLGDAGCISFFPSKNLGAYGDGGMVVTRNKAVYQYVHDWRVHGARIKYRSDFIGDSSRLDTLQASILRAKLPYLHRWASLRRKKAKVYNDLLHDMPVLTPHLAADSTHVFHQYTIVVPERRDQLQAHLKAHGIPTMVYYPVPLHLQKSFEYLRYRKGDLSHSEYAATHVLSLPIYPEIPGAHQQYIARMIKVFFTSN